MKKAYIFFLGGGGAARLVRAGKIVRADETVRAEKFVCSAMRAGRRAVR